MNKDMGLGYMLGSACVLAGAVWLSTAALIYKKERYERHITKELPLCEKVIKIFDTNKDGILQRNEKIGLARALDYEEEFPNKDFVLEFLPERYENVGNECVQLSMESYNFRERRTIPTKYGFIRLKRWSWSVERNIPLSKLRKIIELQEIMTKDEQSLKDINF